MDSWDNIGKAVKKVPKVAEAPRLTDETSNFSDKQIEQWLFEGLGRPSSNVCCGIYGFDGTSKSGIALDCRTEQEKKDGMKLIVFDLDGGCAPLKVIYHDNDKNIIIKNPLVRGADKNVDYEGTFFKLKASLDYIERNLHKLNVKAIIFDGVDKFLKICEYSMRDTVGKSVEDGIDFRYWKIRNQKYHNIMEQIKLLDVDRFFITHLKKEHDGDGWIPDWEKKTPDLLFQRVRCFRETKVEDGVRVTYLKAEIEKCKTNLGLEGAIYTIAEIRKPAEGKATATWKGLTFNRDNTIGQK